MKQKQPENYIKKISIIIFWLLVWFLAALAAGNDIILSSPAATAVSFCQMLVNRKFWQAAAGSFFRIALGFITGFVAAAVLAALSAKVKFIEELLAPVMSLIKAVPVASFAVIFLIWRGSSFLAMAVCFIVVLPNIYINTLEGIKSADKELLEMAEVFDMPLFNRFLYIYRPALEPFMKSALKVSVGMSWKSGVAAEIIGTPASSIGNAIYMSKIVLDTAGVFAWTAVVICLSSLCEKLVLRISDIFFGWGRNNDVKAYKVIENKVNQNLSKKIILSHVNKSFGSLKVLENVNEVYQSGETYYLTGPSGSGKTTLLRILSGLEGADEGSCVDTGNIRFSYVFQEDRLCLDYSAVKNVDMIFRNKHCINAENSIQSNSYEALKKLLPKEALYKPCSELSGGMKRRVALVRAMEAESDCVLLDEPFTGMDEETRRSAENYIRETQRGRILIIATHI
jgi:NitT/TauT family transport system permease protein